MNDNQAVSIVAAMSNSIRTLAAISNDIQSLAVLLQEIKICSNLDMSKINAAKITVDKIYDATGKTKIDIDVLREALTAFDAQTLDYIKQIYGSKVAIDNIGQTDNIKKIVEIYTNWNTIQTIVNAMTTLRSVEDLKEELELVSQASVLNNIASVNGFKTSIVEIHKNLAELETIFNYITPLLTITNFLDEIRTVSNQANLLKISEVSDKVTEIVFIANNFEKIQRVYDSLGANNIPNLANYATKTELAAKANRNDYYQKAEVDQFINELKAATASSSGGTGDVAKSYVDTQLSYKADKTTTYTKAEVNQALENTKQNAMIFATNEISNALTKKADVATTYTKDEVDALIKNLQDQIDALQVQSIDADDMYAAVFYA